MKSQQTMENLNIHEQWRAGDRDGKRLEALPPTPNVFVWLCFMWRFPINFALVNFRKFLTPICLEYQFIDIDIGTSTSVSDSQNDEVTDEAF